MPLIKCSLVAALLVSFALPAAPALAQRYPSRPIRLVVPFAPGGGTDVVARALSQELAESLQQTLVVDNRGGGGGSIGTEIVVRAAPDGYTLLLVTSSYGTNAAVYKLGFDPLADVTPISMVGESGYVVALHPAVPIASVKELIAYAKANPDKLNYGSSGSGGTTHLAPALFGLMTGTKMTHVPYRGGGPAIVDLLAGHIQLMFSPMPLVVPHMKTGRVRGIAITTLKRSSVLPDVPTVAESGVPGYEAVLWFGVLGPKQLPDNVVSRLSAELANALHAPELKKHMVSLGLEMPDTTPEYFRRVIERDIAKWKKVVAMGNIKPGN